MFSFEINLQIQSKLQVQLKGKENLGDFFMTGGGAGGRDGLTSEVDHTILDKQTRVIVI